METTARAARSESISKGHYLDAGALDVSKPWPDPPDWPALLSTFSLDACTRAKLWLTFLESEDNEQHQGNDWKLS